MIIAAFVVLVEVGKRAGQSTAVSPNVIVVFPAAVTGGDSAYLSLAVTELLSLALDGAGEIRGVDPTVLLPAVRRKYPDGFDLVRASSGARELGAGLFVVSLCRCVERRRRPVAAPGQCGATANGRISGRGPVRVRKSAMQRVVRSQPMDAVLGRHRASFLSETT